ncbi:MAG: hypothetical protein GY750_03740 [Lentisphaerae bacterium]|nr:hypothetical protein [Lentisphaerota bacterium]MCP4100526.1 hypothetical protein [Lentisphaerota bacterium]
MNKDEFYLPTMYLRHKRALDMLCSQPEWNSKTLIVRGGSQGGWLALACVGLDDRVTNIFAGVPAMCDNTQNYSFKYWFYDSKTDQGKIDQI